MKVISFIVAMLKNTKDLANLTLSGLINLADVNDAYLFCSRGLSGKTVSLSCRALIKSIVRISLVMYRLS